MEKDEILALYDMTEDQIKDKCPKAWKNTIKALKKEKKKKVSSLSSNLTLTKLTKIFVDSSRSDEGIQRGERGW